MKKGCEYLLFACVLIAACFCLSQCDDIDGDKLSGEIETDFFTIAAGDIKYVTDNLTVTCTGTADISGALLADSDNGQSITIIAEGDITVSGTIAAGNGSSGTNGGNLTLTSNSGDIILTDTASIRAGDGAGGILADKSPSALQKQRNPRLSSIITGGAGGNGGSVTLTAPQGTINVAEATGIIHIGNGADGTDIAIHGEDLLTKDTDEQLTNGGGDSGLLILKAASITGAAYEELSFDEDVTDNETGEVFVSAGTTFYNFTLEGLVSGGMGGSAGNCYYGLDDNGTITWPTDNGTETDNSPLVSHTRIFFDEEADKKKWGDDGGRGWFSAGNGGNASITGQPGADGSGEDGQSVVGKAGDGGNVLFGSRAGNGGSAWAIGGDGGSGAHPDGNGGKGGWAEAYGGFGGNKGYLWFDGNGGPARAKGGDGGDGGGKCPDNVSFTGGKGGDGGNAHAKGGNYSVLDWEVFSGIPFGEDPDTYLGLQKAIGGNAGAGGDSTYNVGFPGSFGEGTIMKVDGTPRFDEQGASNSKGNLCTPTPTPQPTATPKPTATPEPTTTPKPTETPTPTPTPKPTPVPGKYCSCTTPGVEFEIVYYDNYSPWSDCGEATACESMIGSNEVDDGSEMADPDGHCTMKINCP